jgi:hypothetical protein
MFRIIVTAAAVAGLAVSASAQMTQFCRPGIDAGLMSCPCANPPSGGGLGCDNFQGSSVMSGTLDASGTPALDDVILHATGLNNSLSGTLAIFIQSRAATAPSGVAYAAGIRCVASGTGTNFKRMYTAMAIQGVIDRPSAIDPSIKTRSASPPGPIDVINSGDTRYYFTFYRDPNAAGPCGNTASTFNCTNSGSILW